MVERLKTLMIAALLIALAGSIALAATGGEAEVRINARQLEDGRVEFALQQRVDGEWGERQFPRSRYFSADAAVGRWLNSTPLTVTVEEPKLRTVGNGHVTIRKGNVTSDWIGYPEFNFTLTNHHSSDLIYFEVRFTFSNNAGDSAGRGGTWQWNTDLPTGQSRSYTMDDNAGLRGATRFTVTLVRAVWDNDQQWCSDDNRWSCGDY